MFKIRCSKPFNQTFLTMVFSRLLWSTCLLYMKSQNLMNNLYIINTMLQVNHKCVLQWYCLNFSSSQVTHSYDGLSVFCVNDEENALLLNSSPLIFYAPCNIKKPNIKCMFYIEINKTKLICHQNQIPYKFNP